MIADEFRGSKYSDSLTTVQIAALVRSEIKGAIKSGTLPKGIKVSVRSERFSGGSSISASIKAFPGITLNPARVFSDALNLWEQNTRFLHTAAVNTARKTIENIMNAYLRDASDVQSDYFNVNFYGSVEVRIDTQAERAALLESTELADLRVAKAAGIDVIGQLDAYDTNPRWLFVNGVGHFSHDGV